MSVPTTTRQWLFNAHPEGDVDLDGPNPTFKLVDAPLPALNDGQVLVKPVYFSNEPAQRMWISSAAEPGRLYLPPVQLHTPMRSVALAQVVASRDEKVRPGHRVVIPTGWAEYAVVRAKDCIPAPPLGQGLRETLYLGTLGTTGLTAYHGLVGVLEVKAEDTLVVSGAAGATGSMAVQLAKHMLGCKRVIGIAGGAKKCHYVKALGADECVDYKSPTFKEDLYKATGREVTAYFDSVGGSVLDLMFLCMARHGRIAACGAISTYNDKANSAEPLNNWGEVISLRLEIKGFIVFDFLKRRTEFLDVARRGIEQGKIRVDASAETVVPTRFEDVPRTWLQLFAGANTGKLVTQLVE